MPKVQQLEMLRQEDHLNSRVLRAAWIKSRDLCGSGVSVGKNEGVVAYLVPG